MANKITVTSLGTTANVNATPDSARYYSEKSKEWAISDKLIDNEDYSSKYYANESKKQADISTAKTAEVIESGNNAVSNIESARDNAITDITNQENLSVDNVKTAGTTQVVNINSAGTTQINLAKEQVALATNQANIATGQATIATSQASIAISKTTEVVESGNTALLNIETAKNNALNDINTTGAEYVNSAEQYAQNALNSANSAALSESNALSYKNSAQESSQTATEQASIAVTNANKAITSATNAKTSETNAKTSETRCEEILSRLGTAIKIKGRVNSLGDLPLSGNLNGDTYLIGEEGLDSYPEYYWYQDHWEFLGTTGTSLSWGLITGDITAQTDLQTALDSKQDKGDYALKSEIPTNNKQLINGAGYITSNYHDSTKQDVIPDLATIRSGADKGATAIQNTNDCVHKTGNETISGVKTFTGGPVFSNDAFGGQLSVNRTNNSNGHSAVKFLNGGTVKGYLGIDANGNPVYCNSSNATYNLVRNSTTNTAVGSATKPVYINSSGVATVITSYEGNSATATKATQDSNGNNIVNTYATKTSLNAKADTSLSNITDAGKQVIKDNSGGWNPPLLSSFWADHLLNRMDMLRADTFSWQDGTTYSSVYNELLSEYNNSASTTKTDSNITYKRTPKGYKIALATQETAILNKYNSDGIAWYYILDTTNKRFKLPRTKFGFEGLRTSVGDDIAESLPNITGEDHMGWANVHSGIVNNAELKSGCFVHPTYTGRGETLGGASNGNASTPRGIKFDASSSSSTYQDNAPVQERATQMYLYFYVGNFTESAEAQTAGLKAELLNGKADVDTPSIQAPYLKDTYVNGTSGYRIWSDGYCEQWGYFDSEGAAYNLKTISFLKEFRDENYQVHITIYNEDYGGTCGVYHLCAHNKTTSSFQTYFDGNMQRKMWKACGYLAAGEY